MSHKSPTYISWQSMKTRCTNPNRDFSHTYYGLYYDPSWDGFINGIIFCLLVGLAYLNLSDFGSTVNDASRELSRCEKITKAPCSITFNVVGG
jgi:hypothetical protein